MKQLHIDIMDAATHILNGFSGYTNSLEHKDEYHSLARDISSGVSYDHNLSKQKDTSLIGNLYDEDSDKKKNPIVMDEEDKHHFHQILKEGNQPRDVVTHLKHFNEKYNNVGRNSLKSRMTGPYEVTPNLMKSNDTLRNSIIMKHFKTISSDSGFMGNSPEFLRPTMRIHGFSDREIKENSPSYDRGSLISGWYKSGRNNAAQHIISHVMSERSTSHVRPNSFGHHSIDSDIYTEERNEVNKIKGETESFYKNKFKSNLVDGKTLKDLPITLHRGVFLQHNHTHYAPNGAESWSSSEKTPKQYMSSLLKSKNFLQSSGHLKQRVLKTTVSYNDILMSHESHKGEIPDEKSLVAKKEFVVLGGGIKHVE